jgi:hypothetical protein
MMMKHALLLLAAAATLWATPPAMAADGPLFSCVSAASNVCRFRIFYSRGDRIVVLTGGMQQNVPGVTVGKDRYCMAIHQNPGSRCAAKLVAASNS